MRKLLLAALLLCAHQAQAACAFANVAGTNYNYANQQAATDLAVTKPTATVDGAVELIIAGLKSQTAGSHVIANFANETVIQSANSATLFTAGALWRQAFTADGASVDYNHTSGVSNQRSVLVMTLLGCDTTTAIRAFGTAATGNGTAATSPDTSSATAGDLVVRVLVWYDNGDGLTITHPGSHTAIAADFKPGAADGMGLAISFTTSAGGTPGTAAWTISSARDFVAFTIVVAQTGGGGGGTVINPLSGGGGAAARPITTFH